MADSIKNNFYVNDIKINTLCFVDDQIIIADN